MKKYIFKTGFILVLLFSFSCEEYLDKAPEAIISKDDVFKDFDHAQGFIEELYVFVVDYQRAGHYNSDYLYGDETIINRSWQPSAQIDIGNLWYLANGGYSYTGKNGSTSGSQARTRPGIWEGGLEGIRKANLAIENIELMVNATEDEKNVILGQAYFFRAFFHLEIMKFWGRFPYIDEVLVDEYQLKRPETYKESALKANEDFKRAAELLPLDWDNETYGQKTFGENKARVTKGAAYAYQGKNLLIAASPLMKGSKNTYDYDTELAAMAAEAFAEVLKIADQGRYALATFENYEEVFWDVPAKVWPGGSEFIFTGSSFDWSQLRRIVDIQMDNTVAGGSGMLLSPTHNFIYHNFGMSNGLSIEDDASGKYGTPLYDPTKPFENRDPRFYKWITVDGDVLSTKAAAGNHQTAKLYTGGTHRGSTGSKTGYFFKKFYPALHSKWNVTKDKHTPWRIHMRFTDIYLMYAEALQAANNIATSSSNSYNLTAEQAINKLRDRAGIPHVHASMVADANKFMDEIRRERAVELSYEAYRWVDIRRWVVAHLDIYKNKTGLEFPEDHSYFKEYVIVSRLCDYPKHYWIPFKVDQTQLYEGFEQNPGW